MPWIQKTRRIGRIVPAVQTPFGRLAFLIYGHLFNDGPLARSRPLTAHRPISLFARCLRGGRQRLQAAGETADARLTLHA